MCKAGDLVLWDSRTIHCNSPALKPPTTALGYRDDELLRAVVYTCMTPQHMATAFFLFCPTARLGVCTPEPCAS